ncbi:MAG: hypothetical protein PHV09_08265 [Bacteroidales bacterium]|nr:hypothetical protein [Bacteroidales bacterium]MDD2281437.1 hypothetical protein [Bacteroidales bacterium]MDD4293540.1 hypothetical protein [Bacteroidales bacterium]MDD4492502.1 hypothetical protein [Bacteroidales bacterium]NTU95935.1 hypothetical protein [Bacteroidales bacterium]
MESKDKSAAKQLAQIRKSLAEIEELRYKALKNSVNGIKSGEQQFRDISLGPKTPTPLMQLELASVDLRRTERELVSKIGTDIASKIKADGDSLETLAAKIRKRVEKMGRLPKQLDKLSKVILNIVTII